MDLGADVNAPDAGPFGWSPLRYAFEYGRYEVAYVLLKEFGADGASGCAQGLTPEDVSVFVNSGLCEEMRENFQNDFVSPAGIPSDAYLPVNERIEESLRNQRADSAICFAAEEGKHELARLLVQKLGADLNATDDKSRTPLHLAAGAGRTATLRVLVKQCGADVGAGSSFGDTPLHVAARCGHCDTARMLVRELGADVGAKNEAGLTPLHHAACGEREMIDVLVKELGADVNARSPAEW